MTSFEIILGEIIASVTVFGTGCLWLARKVVADTLLPEPPKPPEPFNPFQEEREILQLRRKGFVLTHNQETNDLKREKLIVEIMKVEDQLIDLARREGGAQKEKPNADEETVSFAIPDRDDGM
jgi:hypothetical protein